MMKHVAVPIAKNSQSVPVIFGNDLPLVMIAGINVLESRDLAFEVAQHCQQICQSLGMPLVFKASFDKANRSSVHSFRGPGLQTGLRWLADVKEHFQLPILTDVHEPYQAEPVAEVADILQLPAFLCRQTDLVVALARTSRVINIKKAQFLAPDDMRHIIDKFVENNHQQLLLCERGTSFGYHNLIVDMLGIGVMKQSQYPVVMDVTHALQQPGALANSAGGRRAQVLELAKSSVAMGLAGVFLEMHPQPEQAKCDGPCALRLAQLEPFLQQLMALDRLIKALPVIDTA